MSTTGRMIIESIPKWYRKRIVTDNLSVTYPLLIGKCTTLPARFFERHNIPHIQGVDGWNTTDDRNPALGPIYYDKAYEDIVSVQEKKQLEVRNRVWGQKKTGWRDKNAPQEDQRIVSSMEKGKSNVPSNSPP